MSWRVALRRSPKPVLESASEAETLLPDAVCPPSCMLSSP
jgi:hypothetical protein